MNKLITQTALTKLHIDRLSSGFIVGNGTEIKWCAVQDEYVEWELAAQFLLAILHSVCYTFLAEIFVVQYPTPAFFFFTMHHMNVYTCSI